MQRIGGVFRLGSRLRGNDELNYGLFLDTTTRSSSDKKVDLEAHFSSHPGMDDPPYRATYTHHEEANVERLTNTVTINGIVDSSSSTWTIRDLDRSEEYKEYLKMSEDCDAMPTETTVGYHETLSGPVTGNFEILYG